MPDIFAAPAPQIDDQIGAAGAIFPEAFGLLKRAVARRRGGERICESNAAIHDFRVMQ